MSEDSQNRKPTVKLPAQGGAVTPEPTRRALSDELLRGQVKDHGKRIAHVERRVDRVEVAIDRPPPVPRPTPLARPSSVVVEQNVATRHRDAAIESNRRQSEADLEQQAVNGAIIAHNRKMESGQADIRTAVAMIGRELGLLPMFPSSVQLSIPPPKPGGKTPAPARRVLPELKRAHAIATAIIVAVEVVREVLHHFHP